MANVVGLVFVVVFVVIASAQAVGAVHGVGPGGVVTTGPRNRNAAVYPNNGAAQLALMLKDYKARGNMVARVACTYDDEIGSLQEGCAQTPEALADPCTYTYCTPIDGGSCLDARPLDGFCNICGGQGDCGDGTDLNTPGQDCLVDGSDPASELWWPQTPLTYNTTCIADVCDEETQCCSARGVALSDGAACAAGSIGAQGVCNNSVCVATGCTEHADCTSASACVASSVCNATSGACIDTPETCTLAFGDCQTDSCNVTTGCEIEFVAESTACDVCGACNAGGTCVSPEVRVTVPTDVVVAPAVCGVPYATTAVPAVLWGERL